MLINIVREPEVEDVGTGSRTHTLGHFVGQEPVPEEWLVKPKLDKSICFLDVKCKNSCDRELYMILQVFIPFLFL